MTDAFLFAGVICSFVFSAIAMVASAITAVIVIGWKNSTHKIEYAAVPDTRVELDVPPDVAAQLPTSPEARTMEQYIREVSKRQSALDDLYEET